MELQKTNSEESAYIESAWRLRALSLFRSRVSHELDMCGVEVCPCRSKLLFSSGFDMVIILWRLIGTQVKLEQKLIGHRKKVNGADIMLI